MNIADQLHAANIRRYQPSIGEQAAALSAGWQALIEQGRAQRNRFAAMKAARAANQCDRDHTMQAILEIMATKPKLWWRSADLVAPLAARGIEKTTVQVCKLMARAAGRGQVQRQTRDDTRRVLYRSG